MKDVIKRGMLHFILVDDDECTLQLTSKVIRNFSRRAVITTFPGAGPAIEYLMSAGLPAGETDTVLLTDLHMPEMDGFELLDRLEDIFEGVKDRPHVFVLSADATGDERHRVFSYNYVIGFLDKPLTEDKLKQVIECVQFPL